jgi:hypothetical protein
MPFSKMCVAANTHMTTVARVVSFQANFDTVYDQLEELLAKRPASLEQGAAALVPLIGACIVLVEKVSKTSGDRGSAKKELVMALLTKVISDSTLSDDHKLGMQQLLEAMAPSIIDLALDANNGKLIVSATRAFFKRVCSCCCK